MSCFTESSYDSDCTSENSFTSDVSSVSNFTMDKSCNLSYNSDFLNSTHIPKLKSKKKISYNKKNNNHDEQNCTLDVKNRINKDLKVDSKSISENIVISNMHNQISDTICVFEHIKNITIDFIHDKNTFLYMNKLNVALRSRVASKAGNGALLIRSISSDGHPKHKHIISYKLKNNIWIRNKLICEIDNIDIMNKEQNKEPMIFFGNNKYYLCDTDLNCFINDIERNLTILNNSLSYLCSIGKVIQTQKY